MAEYTERASVSAWCNEQIRMANAITMIQKTPSAAVVDVDKVMRFLEGYAFKDEQEVYTNGTILVPLFRVKQALVDKAYNGFLEGG